MRAMGNAAWVGLRQRVREISGNFIVPGAWSPCLYRFGCL